MLQDVSGEDEVETLDEVGMMFRDIQARFAVVMSVGVCEFVSQDFGVALLVGQADTTDRFQPGEVFDSQAVAEQLQ